MVTDVSGAGNSYFAAILPRRVFHPLKSSSRLPDNAGDSPNSSRNYASLVYELSKKVGHLGTFSHGSAKTLRSNFVSAITDYADQAAMRTKKMRGVTLLCSADFDNYM